MKLKVSFYFVLYLVVLVELLAIIVERDNNELELKARLKEYETIQDSVISLYRQPVQVYIQRETDWSIVKNDSLHIIISVSGLQTPEEKASVKYFIKPLLRTGKFTFSVFTETKTGYGNFYFKTNDAGAYDFKVYCLIRRKLPKYLPAIVINGIYEKIGRDFTTYSDTVSFRINTNNQSRYFDRPGRG